MVGVVLGLHRLFCYDNNNQKIITKNIVLITKILKSNAVLCMMNKIGGAWNVY